MGKRKGRRKKDNAASAADAGSAISSYDDITRLCDGFDLANWLEYLKQSPNDKKFSPTAHLLILCYLFDAYAALPELLPRLEADHWASIYAYFIYGIQSISSDLPTVLDTTEAIESQPKRIHLLVQLEKLFLLLPRFPFLLYFALRNSKHAECQELAGRIQEQYHSSPLDDLEKMNFKIQFIDFLFSLYQTILDQELISSVFEEFITILGIRGTAEEITFELIQQELPTIINDHCVYFLLEKINPDFNNYHHHIIKFLTLNYKIGIYRNNFSKEWNILFICAINWIHENFKLYPIFEAAQLIVNTALIDIIRSNGFMDIIEKLILSKNVKFHYAFFVSQTLTIESTLKDKEKPILFLICFQYILQSRKDFDFSENPELLELNLKNLNYYRNIFEEIISYYNNNPNQLSYIILLFLALIDHEIKPVSNLLLFDLKKMNPVDFSEIEKYMTEIDDFLSGLDLLVSEPLSIMPVADRFQFVFNLLMAIPKSYYQNNTALVYEVLFRLNFVSIAISESQDEFSKTLNAKMKDIFKRFHAYPQEIALGWFVSFNKTIPFIFFIDYFKDQIPEAVFQHVEEFCIYWPPHARHAELPLRKKILGDRASKQSELVEAEYSKDLNDYEMLILSYLVVCNYQLGFFYYSFDNETKILWRNCSPPEIIPGFDPFISLSLPPINILEHIQSTEALHCLIQLLLKDAEIIKNIIKQIVEIPSLLEKTAHQLSQLETLKSEFFDMMGEIDLLNGRHPGLKETMIAKHRYNFAVENVEDKRLPALPHHTSTELPLTAILERFQVDTAELERHHDSISAQYEKQKILFKHSKECKNHMDHAIDITAKTVDKLILIKREWGTLIDEYSHIETWIHEVKRNIDLKALPQTIQSDYKILRKKFETYFKDLSEKLKNLPDETKINPDNYERVNKRIEELSTTTTSTKYNEVRILYDKIRPFINLTLESQKKLTTSVAPAALLAQSMLSALSPPEIELGVGLAKSRRFPNLDALQFLELNELILPATYHGMQLQALLSGSLEPLQKIYALYYHLSSLLRIEDKDNQLSNLFIHYLPRLITKDLTLEDLELFANLYLADKFDPLKEIPLMTKLRNEYAFVQGNMTVANQDLRPIVLDLYLNLETHFQHFEGEHQRSIQAGYVLMLISLYNEISYAMRDRVDNDIYTYTQEELDQLFAVEERFWLNDSAELNRNDLTWFYYLRLARNQLLHRKSADFEESLDPIFATYIEIRQSTTTPRIS